MAQNAGIQFSTRKECLEGFARTFGVYHPREPVPAWWDAFDQWYRQARAEERLRMDDDPAVTGLSLRMEAFGYEDEDEDENHSYVDPEAD